MANDIEKLKYEGRISSFNPADITPEDVREFYTFLKERGLSSKGISHELSALKMLCKFVGNNCVDTAKSKYPAMMVIARHSRLNTLSVEDFHTIFHHSLSLDRRDYFRCRAYGLVFLCIGAGLRTKELQYACIENLDLDNGTLFIDRVKGEGTYGEARTISIMRECVPVVRRYMDALKDHSGGVLGSGALFPSPDGCYLSTNTMRAIKERVCEETGVDFSFQMCRRTYGQYALDVGISLESVSVLMGHSTTKTTENYYARRKGSVAVDEAREKWRSD